MTRGAAARELALALGAASVQGANDPPPVKLDAAILFAPVGELVLPALEALDRGGTLAIAGIYVSDIPALDYERHLAGQGPAGAGPGGAGPAGNRNDGVQWSPVLVVLAIAALGVMLLLGVLIGKDDGDLTVTEVPASTTTTTPTASSSTTTTTPTTTPTTTTPTTTTTPLPDQSGTAPDAQRDGAGGLSAPGGTD